MRLELHNSVSAAKAVLGRALFALSRFNRIHIIGCSRSGTTVLHLAMACFSNVVLSELETDVRYPYLLGRADLALRFGWRPGRKHYVTKRASGWHKPENVKELIKQVRCEDIGLIHLIRDPRDVMLSHYPGRSEPYVSVEHWYESILAGDRIFHELGDHPRKLTLRYEDLVLDSERTAQRISAVFGLQKNPGAFPISQVKDNFEHLHIRFASFALRNLNGLRNMDSNSIGRWRQGEIPSTVNELKPYVRQRFNAFCAEHDYS
jgi:hypothetical protein